MDWGGLGLRVMVIGVGATAFMDLWAWGQKRLLGIPSLDYAMVGRWLGGLTRGKIIHEAISRSTPISGETAIGWTAHYAIGIVFAGLLVTVAGEDWLRQPALSSALLIGLATVAAPFLILQPGMGAGIAASRTPRPVAAWIRSIVAHLSFGAGLYLTASAMTRVAPL